MADKDIVQVKDDSFLLSHQVKGELMK